MKSLAPLVLHELNAVPVVRTHVVHHAAEIDNPAPPMTVIAVVLEQNSGQWTRNLR